MKLTKQHAMSSYGVPVLVDENNQAYGAADRLPNGSIAYVWVKNNIPDSDENKEKFLKSFPEMHDQS